MASSAQLKGELNSLNSKLSTMQKRLKAIKSAKSGLEKAVNSAVDQYNSKVTSCSQKIGSGMSGFSNVSTLCSDLKAKKEGSYSESKGLYAVMNNINLEEGRCQSEITQLESQIRQKERDYRSAKEAEDAEQGAC